MRRVKLSHKMLLAGLSFRRPAPEQPPGEDALYVVELRAHDEPEHIAARYRVVEELLGERATNRSVVWAEGPSPLARTLDAVAMGDLVSVYLAILYQTDPTPVTLLAMLKERLARSTD